MVDIDTDREQEAGETIGTKLRRAREQSGLSVSDVSKKLYVNELKVRALESDDYNKLPTPTFVQGYIRKYAALLKIDGDALVTQYLQHLQTLPDVPEELVSTHEKVEPMVVGGRRPPKWILPAALFSVAVLVLGGIVWYSSDDDLSSTGPSILDAQDDLDLDEPASDIAAITNELGRQSQITEGSSPPDQSRESQTDYVEAGGDAESTTVANSTAPGPVEELVFGFSGECWLEVMDASGEVIHADLHNVGDPVVVHGVAPFSVMLGNARAASVSLNGEPVTIDILPGYRTARINIE